MRVIALVNQKGGVAKTTSTLNIGAGLALAGKRVLLLDMDPQGNLTEGFRLDPDTIETSVYDVLIAGTSIKDAKLQVGDRIDLVPANGALAGAEVELLKLQNKNLRLRQALQGTRGYDYILIDCPPSLGQLTVNALCAAREVFIPIQAEFYALRGLKKLLATVKAVKVQINSHLRITGVIATRYDARKKLNQGVVDQLRNHFGPRFFKTMIRDNIALAEAPAVGMNIFDFRTSSYGAEDYRSLTNEILAMETKK